MPKTRNPLRLTSLVQTVSQLRHLSLPEKLIILLNGCVFASAGITIGMGIWLAMPFDTLSQASPLTRFMIHTFPECVWSVLFLLVGGFEMWTIFYASLQIRKWGARVMLIFLLMMLITAKFESPYSMLIPIFAVLAIFQMGGIYVLKVKIAKNARIVVRYREMKLE